MKKIFFSITLFILILFLILIAVASYAYFTTRNHLQGKVFLKGLTGQVTVTRDQYGIPHINAKASDLDAFFALGYVQAQDRFWQMDIQRHIAAGTLSEYFGKTTLAKDRFLRTWGFYRAAKAAWPALTQKTQRILRSYTAGVNAFLKTANLPLPYLIIQIKPQAWSVIDSLAWAKMMAFDLETSWSHKIENYQIVTQFGVKALPILLPPYPASAATILNDQELLQSGISLKKKALQNQALSQHFLTQQLNALNDYIAGMKAQLHLAKTAGKGSNNWVVDGAHSQTGKPILANDPHLDLKIPDVWYLVELKSPNLHVSGATLAGIPAVILGHNDHIAWGVTNVNPDASDLYIEPASAVIKTQIEKIYIKGQKPELLKIEYTQHGVVISDVVKVPFIHNNQKYKVALQWVALQPNDTSAEAFCELNYAKNWQEFTYALSHYIGPTQNFIYADQNNNIGYYMAGKIPIRHGWNGSLPVLPNQAYQWSGFIPFAKLPHVFNPHKGYLASANNKVVPDNYPYQINFRWYEPPFRIERILMLLNNGKINSVTKFKKMQHDFQDMYWQQLKAHLLKTKPLDQNSKKALAYLKKWDGNLTRNSIGATIYAAWYRQLSLMPVKHLKFTDSWRQPLFILQQLAHNGEFCHDGHENCDAYLSHSLQAAVSKLQQQYGHITHWQWGKVHQALFPEMVLGQNAWLGLIFNRKIATGGGYYTVDPGTYRANNFQQYNGAGFREIIDFNDLDHSQFMITPGESGDLFSSHYADLMPLWRDGRYITISAKAKDWGKTQVLTLLPIRICSPPLALY